MLVIIENFFSTSSRGEKMYCKSEVRSSRGRGKPRSVRWLDRVGENLRVNFLNVRWCRELEGLTGGILGLFTIVNPQGSDLYNGSFREKNWLAKKILQRSTLQNFRSHEGTYVKNFARLSCYTVYHCLFLNLRL